MKKRVACILLGLSLSAMSLSMVGCNSEDEITAVEYEDLNVSEERPAVDTIVNYSDFMGTIQVADTVSVVPLVSGEVTETYFEVGDYVNVGDLLFSIDDTQARQGVASAKAAYASTKSSTDRAIGSTLDSQTISATSAYKNAEIGLDTAQYNLNDLCSKIGDTKEAISDIDRQTDEINNQLANIEEACKASSGNVVKLAELTAQAQQLNSQIASLQASKASLESSRDQLESTVHIYENQVKQAQVGMDIATVSLAETVTKGLNEAVDTVNTTLNQAQVAVDNASSSLKYYSVKSPVAGKIEAINVDKYNMAQAGAPSYVITTDDTKKVVFYVSEANISSLTPGQMITAEYGGTNYEGAISDVETTVDPNTGLFKVEATFTGNTDALYTGSSVKISLESSRADAVLTIPLDAVYYESEQAYVYVDDNGIAKKTNIVTGIYDDEKIQILSGLNQNSNVITTWSARLKDGEKVNGVN